MVQPRTTAQNRLRLQTFGVPMLLQIEGGTPANAVQIRRKDLALLIYLCVERKSTHGRAKLASMLWGDASEEHARHSLTQSLTRLRAILGSEIILLTPDGVEWRGGLRSDTAALHGEQEGHITHLPTAAFLADFDVGRGGAEFEIWAEGKRSYYRLKLLRVLEQVGLEAEKKEAWEEALGLGQRAIEIDPIYEEGHRRVMRAWSAMGERGLALQHYRSFRQWVWDELEDDPEPATVALAESLMEPSAAPVDSRADAHRLITSSRRGAEGYRWAVTDRIRSLSPTSAVQVHGWIRSSWTKRSLRTMPGWIGACLLLITALLPLRWLSADERDVAPGEGQPFFSVGEGMPFFTYDGSLRRYPDWETFLACSSWQPGVAVRGDNLPAGSTPTDLPSVLENPWLAGYALVRSENDPAIDYAIIGCVKSPVPESSPARLSKPGPVHVVADSILDRLPTGAALATPLRPAGTVLRVAGYSEMRWVLFGGGALEVPNTRVLTSHCRRTIAEVDSAEFASYRVVGRLSASRLPCSSSWMTR